MLTLALTVLVLPRSALLAATFTDFEPPTYSAGTVVTGVDGWTGNGNGVVTPYPAGEPYGSAVLEGTQSLWMLIDNEKRGWGSSPIAKLIVTNGTYISWLMERPTGFGRSLLYLWDSGNVVNQPAGLGMGVNGNFEVFATDGTDTGVGYETNKVYRMGMHFDFANNIFTAYAENVTDAGPRLNLGTYHTHHGGAWNVASLQSDGGVWLYDYNPTPLPFTASIWDDIQVVPEPTSVLWLALGGLVLWRRRR